VLLEALSTIVALACALASGRRLAAAVAPMRLDPRVLLDALRADDSGRLGERLREVLRGDSRFVVEYGLLAALAIDRDDEREARVAEELLEVRARGQQWARVPRVCASIASSTGFLLASVALIQAMGAIDAMTPEETGAAAHVTLGAALGALAVGIAGAAFCAAVHMRARRILPERMSAIGKLIDSGLLSNRPNS
jgi:hypothetical protein